MRLTPVIEECRRSHESEHRKSRLDLSAMSDNLDCPLRLAIRWKRTFRTFARERERSQCRSTRPPLEPSTHIAL